MFKTTLLAMTLLTSTLLLATPSTAAPMPARPRQDVTAGKILGQSLGGMGAGLLGGLAGAGIGYWVGSAGGGDCSGEEDGSFCIDGGYTGSFYGAYAGYAIGTVTGISLTGRKQGLSGSWLLTAAGNLAGQALALWIRANLNNSALEAATLFAVPTGLSLAAYDGSHAAFGGNGVAAQTPAAGPKAAAQTYRLEIARISF